MKLLILGTPINVVKSAKGVVTFTVRAHAWWEVTDAADDVVVKIVREPLGEWLGYEPVAMYPGLTP